MEKKNRKLPTTEFEHYVDLEALATRLQGRLTTIDIAGHTFYVDIPMNCIRPKDDFTTLGINFDDIENYFIDDSEKYQIPYNPKTHEFIDLDYGIITSIPEGIILIEFPGRQQLDPVGYVRKHGWDLWECLKETPIRSHFVAAVIKWEDTYVPTLIKENIGRNKQEQALKKRQGQKQRRGRGIR